MKGGNKSMTITEAVAIRVKTLLAELNTSQYRIERNSAMNHRTLNDVMTLKNNSINFRTILQICRGLGITPVKFMDDPIFTSAELDID